jgi:hypothetical protein
MGAGAASASALRGLAEPLRLSIPLRDPSTLLLDPETGELVQDVGVAGFAAPIFNITCPSSGGATALGSLTPAWVVNGSSAAHLAPA